MMKVLKRVVARIVTWGMPAWVLLAGCAAPPAPPSLLEQQAICVPADELGYLDLCVLNVENWMDSAYGSAHFYLVSDYSLRLVTELDGGFGVYELSVSPSRRDLAVVENGGEGHPLLTVYNLEHIRAGKDPGRSRSIDPYPGGIYNMRWQGDLLLFDSDGDPVDQDADEMVDRVYSFDPVSGILE